MSSSRAQAVAEGIRLSFGEGLAIDWSIDTLMRAADAGDPQAPPSWELAGALDWDDVEFLRLISAAVGDLALAAVVVRPAGARDHGADGVAAALVGPEGADGAEEALVSTELDHAGALRRLGMEMWLASGAGKRVAADRAGEPAAGAAGVLSREVTPLSVRLDGESGRGLHELIRPG
jgi:hypothetical protein